MASAMKKNMRNSMMGFAIKLGKEFQKKNLIEESRIPKVREVNAWLKQLKSTYRSLFLYDIPDFTKIQTLLLYLVKNHRSELAVIQLCSEVLECVYKHFEENIRKLESSLNNVSDNNEKFKLIVFFVEFAAEFVKLNYFPVNIEITYGYFSQFTAHLVFHRQKGSVEIALKFHPIVKQFWQMITTQLDILKRNGEVGKDLRKQLKRHYFFSIREIFICYLSMAKKKQREWNNYVNIEEHKTYIAYVEQGNELLGWLNNEKLFDEKMGKNKAELDLMQLYPSLSLSYLIVGNYDNAFFFREKYLVFDYKKIEGKYLNQELNEQVCGKIFDGLLASKIEGALFKDSIDITSKNKYQEIEDFCKKIKLRNKLPKTFKLIREKFLELIDFLESSYFANPDEKIIKTSLDVARKLYELTVEMHLKWLRDDSTLAPDQIEWSNSELLQRTLWLYSLKGLPVASNQKRDGFIDAVNRDNVDEKTTVKELFDLVQAPYKAIPLISETLYCIETSNLLLKKMADLAEENLEFGSALFDEKKLIIRGFDADLFNKLIQAFKNKKTIRFSEKDSFSPPQFYDNPIQKPKNTLFGKERRDKKLIKLIEDAAHREAELVKATEARLARYKDEKKANAKNEVVIKEENKNVTTLEDSDLADKTEVVDSFLAMQVKAPQIEFVSHDSGSTGAMLSQLIKGRNEKAKNALDELSQFYIKKAQFYLASAGNIIIRSKSSFGKNDPNAVKFRNGLRWFLRRFFVMLHLLEAHKVYNLGLPIAMTLTDCRHKIVHNRTKLLTLIGLTELLQHHFVTASDYCDTPHRTKEEILNYLSQFNQSLNAPSEMAIFLNEELSWLPYISEIFASENQNELMKKFEIMDDANTNLETMGNDEFQSILSLVATLDSLVDFGERLSQLAIFFEGQASNNEDLSIRQKLTLSKASQFLQENFGNECAEFLFLCRALIRNPVCHNVVLQQEINLDEAVKNIFSVYQIGVYLAMEWSGQTDDPIAYNAQLEGAEHAKEDELTNPTYARTTRS